MIIGKLLYNSKVELSTVAYPTNPVFYVILSSQYAVTALCCIVVFIHLSSFQR